MFNLNARICNVNTELMNLQTIDYNITHKKLELLRKESKQHLFIALGGE